MTPERRSAILAEIGTALGSYRAWRLAILSGVGLVLLLGVVVILVGVFLDGAATLDDIGVPAAFVAILGPILLGGFVVGVSRIRALARHELLLALRASPPTVARAERLAEGGWTGVRFHLPSGAQHTVWLDPRTVDEIGRWVGR